MSVALAYKQAKVAFVSDNSGDSVTRINLVCLTALTTYALWIALQSLLRGVKSLLLDFVVLFLPLLLVLTVLSNYALILNIAIAAAAGLVSAAAKPTAPVQAEQVATKPFYKPFVTVYRAHMMLMTVICILAVDFPAFPRSFGKCETWGTSIMDLGVGSFVFTLGLVQALPILRSEWQPPLRFRLVAALKSSWPVLGLGFARLVMVKGVDYPEHITEYGVHWNFFFTLAILPLLGALVQELRYRMTFTTMAFSLAGVQQLLLYVGMESWVETAPRTNLLFANKEGIASILGYFAIYLIGIDIGLTVLPSDPYQAYRNWNAEKRRKAETKAEDFGKSFTVLTSIVIAWWLSYALASWSRFPGSRVSRQMANLPYVCWVAAFNTTFLLGYAGIEQLFKGRQISTIPPTFDAFNRHGMAVFLLANLLTGLVNLSFNTPEVPKWEAVLILSGYLGLLCLIANLLPKRAIKLKV